MSRRSRRGSRSAGRKSLGIRILLGAGAFILVVMLGGWMWLRTWLHSEDFRHLLEAEAGRGMEAEARFGHFSWDGTVVRTPSFHAEGESVLRRVDAQNLSLDIGLGKVRQGVVQLRDGRIGRLEVEIAPQAGSGIDRSAGNGGAPPVKPPKWYDAFTPDEIELTGLEIGESVARIHLEEGPFSIEGSRWSVRPGSAKGAYEAIGTGGTIRFPWERSPQLEVERAELRYQDDMVFLTEAMFRLYDKGRLKLTGQADLAGGGYAFDGDLKDVDLREVLSEDWKRKLEGQFSATFGVTESDDTPVVNGHLEIQQGVLTGLPILDALGAYGGNPRFRRLALTEASTDFLRKDGSLWLRNLRVGSDGLIRVEGEIGIGANDELTGLIRLGLTPGTLALIPGAETKVFLPGERGLLWTSVRLSGTTGKPEEDLTERLIAAAGVRMFEILPETGEQVLKFSREAISPEMMRELAKHPEIIDQGVELIRRGKKALDGEGDALQEAADLLRDGSDLLDTGKSLFESIRGGK